jgi:restriction endonuclease S subunit
MKSLKDIIQSHGEKGSVGNNLNKQEFSNISIVFPPDILLKEFEKIVLPIFDMIKLKSQEIQHLQALQSLLLAKMASIENNRVFTGRNTNG